ncbi:MAG: deoxyribodipyrimidine photo-lyase, partial [Desulfobulbales bacterium]
MRTDSQIAPERIRRLTMGDVDTGPVVYWMTREHRVADNWALLLAQKIGLEHKRPLVVVFCLVSDYPGANIRHYGFMLKGLQQVEENLKKLNIPFLLLQGPPPDILPRYLVKIKAASLVTDFDPLCIKRTWQNQVAKKITRPFYVVDGHNIVPCWQASPKQEYAAYTLRPKLKKLLPEFLSGFPRLKIHPFSSNEISAPQINWQHIRSYVTDHSVPEVDWLKPGEAEAMKRAKNFIKKGLQTYSLKRNDPNLEGQSNISPYLHFGQIAPQRVALLVKAAKAPVKEKEAFLEEL